MQSIACHLHHFIFCSSCYSSSQGSLRGHNLLIPSRPSFASVLSWQPTTPGLTPPVETGQKLSPRSRMQSIACHLQTVLRLRIVTTCILIWDTYMSTSPMRMQPHSNSQHRLTRRLCPINQTM